MNMTEKETSRKTDLSIAKEIEALESWFRNEYLSRKLTLDRYTFLQLPKDETRLNLETEAYQKEQRLRELKGLPPLPEIKLGSLL